jgi:hypothetical protein
MHLGLAIRAFFRVLFNHQLAAAVRRTLDSQPAEGTDAAVSEPAGDRISETRPEKSAAKLAAKPVRNDAITLLATLQREARFVDLVQESLDQYSDAQIGAAARDVLRDCGQVLERLFGLAPVLADGEGAEVATPPVIDTGRYRMVGQPMGEPPYHGKLVHHGWQASRCDLPQWNGTKESADVVAPAEIEVTS